MSDIKVYTINHRTLASVTIHSWNNYNNMKRALEDSGEQVPYQRLGAPSGGTAAAAAAGDCERESVSPCHSLSHRGALRVCHDHCSSDLDPLSFTETAERGA